MEIQLWREILDPYRQAVDELVVKFNHIKYEYQMEGLYSPIEQVNGRLKRISSILEKAQKKGIPLDEIDGKIDDIAGIRIICQFVEDIKTVVEIIKKRSDITIVEEKDYISHAKKSGYRSYHLIVNYVVQTLEGPKELGVEIQIRTLAMNFWATIEHHLQYKYNENMPDEIRQRLLSAAKAVGALDNEMASVRNEIMDAQISNRQKNTVIISILNEIENLYRSANKREVEKIQDEFFKIYKLDDMDMLLKFEKQLDILAENYRAQSITDD
ncbi:MAG: GTP pyrophosphokinase family protein [Lachnospiraceae bacterium]|nr:GTP pyrophosphokinase family protein [Lachnospiraceae bacterium]